MVLLVDDKEANLLALEAQLGEMECELVRASSGNEALSQLLKHEFALMLLDVQMPDMDGYEVAKYSRENPSTRDVPIIFVTAMNATLEAMLRGYGTGAVDCLFKPINPHVLRSKVRGFLELYLGKKRLAEEVEAHKATLAELELSNAALRHFTHAASHDLRAPLRAMSGFLGALESEAGDGLDPRARHYLDRSQLACRRMSNLLDSLLAYARVAKPLAWTNVDCDAIVAQVRDDLGDRLAAAGATLDIGPLPIVRGDANRLYQLFLNLVSNALKFRNADAPRIEIDIDKRDTRRVIRIADNGIGIDPEYHEKIFDPFERLHGQDTYEGTGLGLTLCRQIVDQHHGAIWVESEPGHGARFYFTLGGL